MKETQRLLQPASLVIAVLLTACGAGDPADQSPPAAVPLGDIVLRAEDYPEGFSVVQERLQVDFTEPFADTPQCRSIGVPANRVSEGVVQGDSVGRGDLSRPPATGAGTAAFRVATAGDAQELLSELKSTDGKRCMESASNVDASVVVRGSSSGGVDVLEVRQESTEVGFVALVLVEDRTVALGILASQGEGIDDSLVTGMVQQLAARLSNS